MSNRAWTWLWLPSLLALTALNSHTEGSRHEVVATSCAFSIENNTGATIPYEYRWGNQGPWKWMKLASGKIETHAYPLGDDLNQKVPTPYIRFDRGGGDKEATWDERRISFRAVGDAGCGPKQNLAQPTRYAFSHAPNGLDLRFGQK